MIKFQPGEEVIDCVKKPQEPLSRCTGMNVADCIKLYWILLILELFHATKGFARMRGALEFTSLAYIL